MVFGDLLNISKLAGLLNSLNQCERYYSWFPWQTSKNYLITKLSKTEKDIDKPFYKAW